LIGLKELGLRFADVQVLAGITLEFPASGLISLVGPNGAGKSTLLGIVAGLRSNYQGSCTYSGTEVRKWQRRSLARHISFVPQALRLEFPFTVEQVIFMGRTPFCDGMFESPDDRVAVEKAMQATDTGQFRNRDFRTLSGGERQRVILASALAQSPETLVLDEPTTFLDLSHQLAIYQLLRELANDGLLVIAATHDLNLALRYSDRVVLLDHGRVVAEGTPASVLIPDRIHSVFGVIAQVQQDAAGRAWITYG
jgi:iron complex transport system ATP-binding protein